MSITPEYWIVIEFSNGYAAKEFALNTGMSQELQMNWRRVERVAPITSVGISVIVDPPHVM